MNSNQPNFFTKLSGPNRAAIKRLPLKRMINCRYCSLSIAFVCSLHFVGFTGYLSFSLAFIGRSFAFTDQHSEDSEVQILKKLNLSWCFILIESLLELLHSDAVTFSDDSPALASSPSKLRSTGFARLAEIHLQEGRTFSSQISRTKSLQIDKFAGGQYAT